MATLEERGLIEEYGRSRFGAVLYRTTPLFEKLFGLENLEALPPIEGFEPSDEEQQELRDKLLKAGEQRVG
jgi:segregation and condensation protein B